MCELGTAAVPILRPDLEHTWIASDLHLGVPAMVDAWSRPVPNLTHMNREFLAERRRAVRRQRHDAVHRRRTRRGPMARSQRRYLQARGWRRVRPPRATTVASPRPGRFSSPSGERRS